MPSAASNVSRREAKRLASLTFFLDHQIGRYIVADALRKAGANVEAHQRWRRAGSAGTRECSTAVTKGARQPTLT